MQVSNVDPCSANSVCIMTMSALWLQFVVDVTTLTAYSWSRKPKSVHAVRATFRLVYDVIYCALSSKIRVVEAIKVASQNDIRRYRKRCAGQRVDAGILGIFIWVGQSKAKQILGRTTGCLLYTSPSPRDGLLSRMPSSA